MCIKNKKLFPLFSPSVSSPLSFPSNEGSWAEEVRKMEEMDEEVMRPEAKKSDGMVRRLLH